MTSNLNFQIRQAVAFDAETLSTLASETFWDTYNGSIDHGDIWAFIRLHFTPEKIRNEINLNSGVYIIVENDEKEAVAYAKLSTDYLPRIIKGKKALEINKIYVAGKIKRSGIGKKLMNFIEDYAKRNAFNCLWLAVWEHNKSAINFYTKMEYIKIADVPFEMGSETHNDYLVVKNV
jgi:ribosomal protein S18 acetylase RimI-like enzyme